MYAKQLKDAYISKLLDLKNLMILDRAGRYDVHHCHSALS